MRLIGQVLHRNRQSQIGKDLAAGIIVALVSIPISMGYAQIAGLPAVYGLYGSLLPIFVFAFLTTSPQFVVGVDAMPAAMVGSLLAELGIVGDSEQAMGLVPVISFLVALWFVLFALIRADRIVKYISTPVMGGFISGVGATIILMQLPKLYGGTAGTGDISNLLSNIISQIPKFHVLSAILGFGTIAIILIGKRVCPKVPLAVIMMVVGAVLEAFFHMENYGVRMLPSVAPGLPKLHLPDFHMLSFGFSEILIESFSIAAVIMAQTLLATGNYAAKYGDKVDRNAELLAYAAMNAAGGVVGCCPINGSVSRSGIADSFGCRSQIMSVTAAVVMLAVLLFGTSFLNLLPVPVLTGIVMTALLGILETNLAKRLFHTQKNEFLIFLLSFSAVLFFGTVNGVLIGCALSFADVAFQAVQPSTCFEGRIPGQGNFYELGRNRNARPIRETVIYRFNGNLFFANVDRFQEDIEKALKPDTRRVIVDARSIDNIDVTAADRLLQISNSLRESGIRFYLTEHSGQLNDTLRQLGAEELIEQGCVRRTITLAMKDDGVEKPYELDDENEYSSEADAIYSDTSQQLAEFEWAFGHEADQRMELLAADITESFLEAENTRHMVETFEQRMDAPAWDQLGLIDVEELLDRIEMRLESIASKGIISQDELTELENLLEKRRERDHRKLETINPRTVEILSKHRKELEEHFKKEHPKEYEHIRALRDRYQG